MARHFTSGRGYAAFSTLVYQAIVPVALTLAGAITLTVPQLLGGLLLLDANGAARNVTLPTAADLVNAIEGAGIGTSFRVTMRNTAGGAFALTAVAGAGGTISGTATVAQNNTKDFLIVLTNVTPGSEAYTAYSVGTFVH